MGNKYVVAFDRMHIMGHIQGTPSTLVCSGSVVVTAYDFESGRRGSNPEWGLIYYKASITAQGLPEPSPSGVVH